MVALGHGLGTRHLHFKNKKFKFGEGLKSRVALRSLAKALSFRFLAPQGNDHTRYPFVLFILPVSKHC